MTTERECMTRAVELARLCEAEERSHGIPPRVGAVVMRKGEVVAEAYRGDPAGGPGDHAEFIALQKKLGAQPLDGAMVFTTLEPCTGGRSEGKSPCVQWIIKRGIGLVYVGMLDPNPEIFGKGLQTLVDAGIDVQLFDPDLQREAAALNRRFALQFQKPGGETSNEVKVGGIAWKLESLVGASWTNRDPTTARVSTLQLIGENHASGAIRSVTGELTTKNGTIAGQLNRDGDLVAPDTLIDVPPTATIILVFPLAPDYWRNGVPLLDLPRLAPLEITIRVEDKDRVLKFSPAETAELVASFIRRHDPDSRPTPRWNGPPPRRKVLDAIEAVTSSPDQEARHRGMMTLMRLKDPTAAADLLEKILLEEMKPT